MAGTAAAGHLPSSLFSPRCLNHNFQTAPYIFHAKIPRHFPSVASLRTQSSVFQPAVSVAEAVSDAELWAAARLRIRAFFDFHANTYKEEDHRMYLAEREFEALKERIAGKRTDFTRVSCINATLPLSQVLHSSDDLCSACKFSQNGEVLVVVGSLDLNRCLWLADEITGKRPEGVGAEFGRAYLSNVCVAKELHRKGVGSVMVAKSKKVAQDWGITDLYAHVAIDNEPAKKFYMKCGFVRENEEPAWQAKFLGRTQRLLLWADLTSEL